MSGDGFLLALGEPWDDSVFHIPREFPSFGWQTDQFLVLGDPDAEVDVGRFERSTIRLGFAQHGPVAFILMKTDGLPMALMEAVRPYLVGDDPPEIHVSPGDHLLWQMVTVSAGVIVNLRAFTTSPQVTVWLRRVFAEQRAHGPITTAECDRWLDSWRAATPDLRETWRRVEVTCKAGD